MTSLLNFDESKYPLPVEMRENVGMAKLLSDLPGVPKQYHGKEKEIFLILLIAKELEISPIVALKNTSVINGTPNLSAALSISLAHRSKIFDSRIKFRQEGESWDELRVWAISSIDGDEVTAEASIKMAIAEGWTKNPKYKSMPVQMLRYRAATFLINAYAPEVLRGIDVDLGGADETIKIDPVSELNEELESNQ